MFQRTPQWIMPIDNAPYGEAQRRAFRDDPALMRQARDGLAQAFADHFAKLSADGTIGMPFEQAPWGDHFGQFDDKFGVSWMFDVGSGEASGS